MTKLERLFGFSLYSEESGMGSTGSFAIPNIAVF